MILVLSREVIGEGNDLQICGQLSKYTSIGAGMELEYDLRLVVNEDEIDVNFTDLNLSIEPALSFE